MMDEQTRELRSAQQWHQNCVEAFRTEPGDDTQRDLDDAKRELDLAWLEHQASR